MHQRMSPKLRVNLGYLIAKRVATQLLTSHGHQDQTVTNPSLLRNGLGSYQPDPLWSVTWISQMRGSSVVLPRIPRDRLQLQRCLKSQVNSIIGYGSSVDETTRLFYSSQRCYLLLNSCLLLRDISERSACSEQESNLWRSEFVCRMHFHWSSEDSLVQKDENWV